MTKSKESISIHIVSREKCIYSYLIHKMNLGLTLERHLKIEV